MKSRKKFCTACGFLGGGIMWTAGVMFVDFQPIGPEGSGVGFAALNGMIHDLIGVHMTLYSITDWLGLVPLAFVIGFTLLGLVQWISRKSIRKVDRSILALGGFYAVVLAAYCFFEVCVVNYRPVLIHGVLEASYPSSTTMLVLCVMTTARMQLNARIRNPKIRRWTTMGITAFLLFMVVARLLSGVHWISDIVGGILLSTGLILLYDAVSKLDQT